MGLTRSAYRVLIRGKGRPRDGADSVPVPTFDEAGPRAPAAHMVRGVIHTASDILLAACKPRPIQTPPSIPFGLYPTTQTALLVVSAPVPPAVLTCPPGRGGGSHGVRCAP